MSEIELKLNYKELKLDRQAISDEAEEQRLDELDELFPKIMELRQEEDLLRGIPVTKYDSDKKNYYTLNPDGTKVYG